MKRYVKSWTVSKPATLTDMYAPFEVTPCYLLPSSCNASGYKISLNNEEWILCKPKSTFSPDCDLYGPFKPYQVRSYDNLSESDKIGTFSGLDEVMDYLDEELLVEY